MSGSIAATAAAVMAMGSALFTGGVIRTGGRSLPEYA
jgi:hypothetical protein